MHTCIYIYIHTYAYLYTYIKTTRDRNPAGDEARGGRRGPDKMIVVVVVVVVRSVFEISNLFLRPRPWQFEI